MTDNILAAILTAAFASGVVGFFEINCTKSEKQEMMTEPFPLLLVMGCPFGVGIFIGGAILLCRRWWQRRKLYAI